MAEPRRVNLISTALPVEKKTPNISPSDPEPGLSFTAVSFSVLQPSNTVGPEYDFEKMLAEKKKNEEPTVSNSEDPFGEEEEEANMVKLAKHFEEKYGGLKGLKELGAGYDHNDPFVDDAGGAESSIPRGWTLQHGGFYISTGPLYARPFRSEEEKTHVYQSVTVDECLAAAKSMAVLSLKRKKTIQSSDEEDSEDSRDNKIKRKKLPVVAKQFGPETEAVPTKKPVAKTVASMLAERADPFASSDDSLPVIEEAATDLRKPKEGSMSSQGGVIKSTARKPDKEIKMEMGDGPVQNIPDEIPDSLRNVIDELKNLAVTWQGGKCNFFSPEHNPVINSLLLRLEYECREFRCGLRSSVFGHVAGFLPCSKETLAKRARKLRQNDVDVKFNELLAKLSRAIQDDGGMDSVSKALKHPIKKLLVEGVRLKMAVYDLHKQKFSTHNDYIRNFVDFELIPLWKNHVVASENIYAEALMALGEALRPSSSAPKVVKIAEDYDMPPAIVSPLIMPQHQSRESSVSSTHRSTKSTNAPQPVRPAVDIMAIARSNSSKSQHSSKAEMKKESVKHVSQSGSSRKSASDSTKRSMPEMKTIYVPDVNGARDPVINYSKKSSSGESHSTSHRSTAPSAHNSTKPSSSKASLEPLDRPPSTSSREKSSSHRSGQTQSDADLRTEGHRSSGSSHKSDRHSTHSPKIISHQTHPISSTGDRPSSRPISASGDRPSSRSSVGSSSKSKNVPATNSAKSLLPRGDFDQNNNFSISSLASPFVHPASSYSHSLPLMAGFSHENLYMSPHMSSGAPLSFLPAELAAFFNPSSYGTNGPNFPRSSAPSPTKVSPASSQNDSPFAAPR